MEVNWKTRLRKYIDEAVGLGIFMFSAGFFDALLEYPGLPLVHLIRSDFLRRLLIGITMGATAMYIFTSRFGKASGAYINPAVTIVRYLVGDINKIDSLFYIIFQFLGGSLGLYLVTFLFPHWMRSADINYIITIPGNSGATVAFILEFLMSMVLIAVVLIMELKKSWDRYTPLVVSILITLFIAFEGPYSGMSINPARTFSSAIVAGQWKDFWLYCTAPVAGMLVGEWIYKRTKKYFLQ